MKNEEIKNGQKKYQNKIVQNNKKFQEITYETIKGNNFNIK